MYSCGVRIYSVSPRCSVTLLFPCSHFQQNCLITTHPSLMSIYIKITQIGRSAGRSAFIWTLTSISQSSLGHKGHCSHSTLCFKYCLVFSQQTIERHYTALGFQAQLSIKELFTLWICCAESVFPWKSSHWPDYQASCEPKGDYNFSPLSSHMF